MFEIRTNKINKNPIMILTFLSQVPTPTNKFQHQMKKLHCLRLWMKQSIMSCRAACYQQRNRVGAKAEKSMSSPRPYGWQKIAQLCIWSSEKHLRRLPIRRRYTIICPKVRTCKGTFIASFFKNSTMKT